MLPGMTVLQALSSAGGFTQFAKVKSIYVLRAENGKESKYLFNYKEVINGKSPSKNFAEGRRHDRGAVGTVMRELKYISMAWICAAVICVAPARGATATDRFATRPTTRAAARAADSADSGNPVSSGFRGRSMETTRREIRSNCSLIRRSLTGVEDLSLGTMRDRA